MSGSTEQDRVNEAIAGCLVSDYSRDVERRLRETFGQEIAARVRAVYDDAMGCPVDWRTASMDEALAALHHFLGATYPWLTAEARRRLNFCFIMTWK